MLKPLVKPRLTGATMSHAQCAGTDFTGADLSDAEREGNTYEDRHSNPTDDRYGPLNPLAESLVKTAMLHKGFRQRR